MKSRDTFDGLPANLVFPSVGHQSKMSSSTFLANRSVIDCAGMRTPAPVPGTPAGSQS
jgi:hypothetical protein